MSEMIERVAEAMKNRRRELIHAPLDRIWDDLARAAIEAMREPTWTMKRTAYEECGTTDLASEEDFTDHYGEVWETMIDEALGKSTLPLSTSPSRTNWTIRRQAS